MRINRLILFLLLLCSFGNTQAGEGMWLPQLLHKLNESEMKSLGMKISAKDIYSINNGSLKDAIVSFGGFCTGEIISSQGLVLTNHHCGFDAIQNHSSIEHNYIQNGFWAANKKKELPNKGLFATFIVRIDDISKDVLKGVVPTLTESERQALIEKNINEIKSKAKKDSTQDCFVRGFFEGNQYYLFITETFRDIRLVGAPPSSIGNFGKDTDNWMWPRHTGDFSIFRIYASKNNTPADYSPDNIPYTPKRSLSISMDGVAENDFTMVLGFPGRTNEYLYSAAVEQIINHNDPAKIAIRAKALSILDGFMRKNEAIKIQYAAKYANIQNAYKKWQGEVMGLRRTHALNKKLTFEKLLNDRINSNPLWKAAYGNVTNQLNEAYAEWKPYSIAKDYYTEIVNKVELFAICSQLQALATAFDKGGEKGFQQRLPVVKKTLEELFAEYNPAVDQQLFEGLMAIYLNQPEHAFVSAALNQQFEAEGKNTASLAKIFYSKSYVSIADSVFSLLKKPTNTILDEVRNNICTQLYRDITSTYQTNVLSKLSEMQARINRLNRTYMAAQMEIMKEKRFYPDANSTLRATYGNVKGYESRDAVRFDYYTFLDGVMEKYIPGDYEFDVPEKLIRLYKTKDFAPYSTNGKMPVCFIASNHTTGGNSGSPALDAYGNLVGLNFDRVWEGTMSDLNYDASICRNIMVDIRYVLFIIDKYAGAKHLVDEMKLVHPKKRK